MAIYFDSAAIYIDSATSLCDKIERIDLVIDALLTNALKAAANENITEYSLNDGQTVIKTVYRGSASVEASIAAFERIKQMYVNRLNGRVFRLVDSKSISGRR
jgi:basic membrane lipoprotein Med (substrate-binding protein (PBP1-ABC) superfamily)